MDFPNRGDLKVRITSTSARNAASAEVPTLLLLWRHPFLQHVFANMAEMPCMLIKSASLVYIVLVRRAPPPRRDLEEEEEEAAAVSVLMELSVILTVVVDPTEVVVTTPGPEASSAAGGLFFAISMRIFCIKGD